MMLMLRLISCVLAGVLVVILGAACSDESPPLVQVNHAPELAPIGSQWVRWGDSLKVAISASDPDGAVPFLFAFGLPENSEFYDHGDGSGLFRFLPESEQFGTHLVQFLASDGELADTEEVVVQVETRINHAPELDSIPPRVVLEGSNLNFEVTAADADGDSIVLTANEMPDNATFVDHGDGSGTFDFSPDFDQQGLYIVWFTAYDGFESVHRTAYINVINMQ